MGKEPVKISKNFTDLNNNSVTKEVELYTWEKLDYVDKLKKTFNI